MKFSRALVTGANGFIGSNLCQRLCANNVEVTACVRPNSRRTGLAELPIHFVEGDLRKPGEWSDAIAKSDVIFHLAGRTGGWRDRDFLPANRDVAKAVAAAAAASDNPPKLILVSSLAAAGPSPIGKPRTPADAPSPVSRYGASKLAGELASVAYCKKIHLTIIRPGVVFGPWDREVLQLFKTISVGRVNPIAGFRPPKVSMMHVDDLVALLVAAAEHGKSVQGPPDETGGTGYYFAADRQFLTFVELGHLCAQALGRKRAVPIHLPIGLIIATAFASQSIVSLSNRTTTINVDKIREASAASWECDPSTTYNEIPFQPALPLKERIAETIQWYRKKGWI